MRLLLDTHVALWAIHGIRLSPAALRTIDRADAVDVSVVSIWEIAIKHALHRGRDHDIDLNGHQARDAFLTAGFALLPVSVDHACAVDDLPRLHGDPFDRLLIAQARVEGATLLTADRALEAYGEPVALV